MTQLTPTSLGKTLHWVLSLTWAGRDWYWSTDRVTITRDDGTTIQTEGGLSVTFRQAVALLLDAGQGGEPEVMVGPLVLDAYPEIDLPTEIEAGRHVTGSACALSLWAEGETWEAREVKLVGIARLTQYGTTEEGLSFVIRPPAVDAGAIDPFPMRNGNVSAADKAAGIEFDNNSAAGMMPAFVFGAPGIEGDALDCTFRGGSPGIQQNAEAARPRTSVLVIAQHKVLATSVELINTTIAGIDTAVTVSSSTDPDGRIYSYCVLSWSLPTPLNEGFSTHPGDEIWVQWKGSAGGLPSRRYPGKPLRGGGELSIEMLERGRIRYDAARWESVLPILDSYLFDGYIDEATESLSWLRDVLWPLLPISIGYGGKGLYPVVWTPGRPDADAVRHLYADADGGTLSRVSDVLEQDSHLQNEHVLLYQPRSDGKGYAGRVVLTGRERRPQPSYATVADQPLAEQRLHLHQSVSHFGVRSGPAVESDIIYSDQTARMVLGWRSVLLSQPWRQITYALERPDAALQAGDEVLVTDSEIGLSARKAWVSMVEWRDLDPVISVVLLPEVS